MSCRANSSSPCELRGKWGDDGEGRGTAFAGTKSIFPEHLDAELSDEMERVALESFHALRLRDCARIDLRVTAAGEIYVLEVNPNCYLERESEFASAAARAGLEYEVLVARITDLVMARYARWNGKGAGGTLTPWLILLKNG